MINTCSKKKTMFVFEVFLSVVINVCNTTFYFVSLGVFQFL